MVLGICSLILGVIGIGLGIHFITMPIEAYTIIPMLTGIAILVEGIGCIATWLQIHQSGGSAPLVMFKGVLSVILGIVLLTSYQLQLALAEMYVIFAAVWMLMAGVLRVAEAIRIRSFRREAYDVTLDSGLRARLKEISGNWWISLILGIAMILLAVLSIAHPFSAMIAIGVFIGADVLVAGINLIVLACAVL